MFATLLVVLVLPFGGVQEADDPEAQYRQEYATFTDISAVADPAARATQFMDFQDEGFDQRLAEYVTGGVQTALVELTESQRYDDLYPLADRWDEQTGGYTGAAIGLQASAADGNNEMITKYGEIVYAQQPVADIAQVIATSYSALDNNEKFLEFANITIDAKGLAEAFDFAYNIFGQALAAQNWDEAADWARRLKGLASAPAGVSATEWQGMQVEFQTTIARAAYEGERWDVAIREYQALGAMGRGQRGISNFYLGQIYLKTEQFNLAMQRFADASLANDQRFSSGSRSMLEEIYKANTGGTLEGLEENVLGAARARMR
jgi:hypothetical protein